MSRAAVEWLSAALCSLLFVVPFWWTSRRDRRDTLLTLLVWPAVTLGAYGLLQLRLAL